MILAHSSARHAHCPACRALSGGAASERLETSGRTRIVQGFHVMDATHCIDILALFQQRKRKRMLIETAASAGVRKRKIGSKTLAKHMKRITSFMLLALAAILLAFLMRETWILIEILLSRQAGHNSYEMIEAIIIWFLYFEFIALIGKYFESRLHFPLRYFIYIGITAIIRLIIVDHSNPTATLVYSLALLALLVSLYIANTSLLKRI